MVHDLSKCLLLGVLNTEKHSGMFEAPQFSWICSQMLMLMLMLPSAYKSYAEATKPWGIKGGEKRKTRLFLTYCAPLGFQRYVHSSEYLWWCHCVNVQGNKQKAAIFLLLHHFKNNEIKWLPSGRISRKLRYFRILGRTWGQRCKSGNKKYI